jgi:hypothetical protein
MFGTMPSPGLGYWRIRIDANGDLVIEVRDSGSWVQQASWTA